MYRHVDSNGRRYRLDNLTGPGGAAKGNPQYEFLGVTRYWRYSRERMQALYEAGRIVQTRPGRVPAYKRYLDEMPGPRPRHLDDIPPVSSAAKERLGYPTQKPLALLERIVNASSNPGDVVLDPFYGCGTAVHAAQKLGRRWLGIDVTHLAISLIRRRMQDAFPASRSPSSASRSTWPAPATSPPATSTSSSGGPSTASARSPSPARGRGPTEASTASSPSSPGRRRTTSGPSSP